MASAVAIFAIAGEVAPIGGRGAKVQGLGTRSNSADGRAESAAVIRYPDIPISLKTLSLPGTAATVDRDRGATHVRGAFAVDGPSSSHRDESAEPAVG